MIGMSISDLSALAAVMLGLSISAYAADVSLVGDGKLTGEVVSMDSSGTITLASPVSQHPLLVNGARVESVNFGLEDAKFPLPDQRVELINGDVLPVQVDGLDETMLQVSSSDLGSFGIPRKMVDSIRLGMVPERVVYEGHDSASGWIRDSGGARNWEIKDGQYLATGQGTISRELALPEKFILRFQLNWQAHPNFRMYFAGPATQPNEQANRYYLQFSGSGFEIRRELMAKSRYTPIVLLSRTPEDFPDGKLVVELRVDRTTGLLQLSLNGQIEGRYLDPVPEIPSGGMITMVSQAPQDSEQSVTNLEILEWDDRADRHRSEDRGDTKLDALIGRFGERFGGSLAQIRKDDSGAVYLFKSDFQKDLIELPEEEVSTIFFASPEGKRKKPKAEGLILRLRGGGDMRVSTCEFGQNKVTAIHPLLGEVSIDRAGITSLERKNIPKAQPVEER